MRGGRSVGSVLALTLWTQACMVYRAPPDDDLTRLHGREVRVRSQSPFSVTRMVDTATRAVTSIEGKVARVRGDTLVLERAASVPVDGSFTRFRRQQELVMLTLPVEAEVRVHELHRGRTAALVIGVPAVVVGLIAWAVSQMSFVGGLSLEFSRR